MLSNLQSSLPGQQVLAKLAAKLPLNGDTTTLEVVISETMDVYPRSSELYWYYEQSANVIAPMRYLQGEEPTAENTLCQPSGRLAGKKVF
ncbi:hypothetical protein [Photorhabdus viridis]|uniref:hypothetical protein n=1 Tax=Photorhabdus viridis TaxID=3163327 RepID=UPI0033072DE6